MLLYVPYNYPGTVKQVTADGDSTEVILALSKNPSESKLQNTLEITVLIKQSVPGTLSIKRKDPAYATFFCHNGIFPPGSGKEMHTVKNTEKRWVTISHGPATMEQIKKERETAMINQSPPSATTEIMWSHGYLFADKYNDIIVETDRKGGCEYEDNNYQIETILQPSPRNTWKTILHGTDCKAKILNQQATFSYSAGHPAGDAVAWAHGYATHEALNAAFASPNFFEVNGPTLAGFICKGLDSPRELFTSQEELPGKNTWAVPVNLFHDTKCIGSSSVVNIELNPKR
jgi:hypothetical protein